MEPRARHILVGLFVVLGISAALSFSLWLNRPGAGQNTDTYIVVFNEAVTGLTVGSAVRYTGIPVGRVTQLQLDPDDARKVRARIEVDATTPVKADTSAQLHMAGITGGAEIRLSGGSPDSPPLTRPGDEPPVIEAQPSPLAQLTGGGAQLLDQFMKLMDRVEQVLSAENVRNLSATLNNLNRISGDVADHSDEIVQAIANINAISSKVRRAVDDAAQLAQRANAMLDESGGELVERASRALASLERAGARLDRLLRENEGALNAGMQALRNVGPALQELRATLSSLREISRRLEDNPREYLFGGDDVPEFQP